ncbi:MAG TPA: hypothetical protein VFK16_03625 [Gemmatimonadaceae bacterium]|nr:hypothetical protein [Gemmatimonadaceae bacterium]
MPIPDLSTDGLLPDGLHECTLDEVIERFGRFQDSDRRPSLGRELQQYVAEVRSAEVGKYLVVDGSFVTSKPSPSDIDLLLVLRDDVNLGEVVPPFRYNARSRTYIRKKYRFDFFPAFDGDGSADAVIRFFRQVKYRPGEVKGLLKVTL